MTAFTFATKSQNFCLAVITQVLLGPLNTYFRKEEAAWMKQNAQREIKRCHMEGLIGVVGNNAYSVGDCVSAFESTSRNYPCTNEMRNLITSVVHY
jgi:hypothetical protein